MAREFDVGATLQLKNVARFRGDADVAAESVDNIREKADRTSRSLSIMGKIGRGAGRAALTGLKRAALGAGVAIAAIGAFAIRASLGAQSAQAQIVAGIKSTGGAAKVTAGDVEELSTRIQNYSGIARDLVKQGAAVLLTFTGVRNEVGKGNDVFDQALKASADLAVRFKTDLPNASKMLGKALQDPIKGVTALRRVGVSFNAQQLAQIKYLVETNQLLAAQKVILAEVNKESGGSARAAGQTDAGRFAIFKEKVQNSLEAVGASLLPVVTNVLPMLAKLLAQVFTGLAPVLKQVAGSLGKVLPGIIKALLPAIRILGGLFATLAKVAGPIIQVLATTFARFLKAIMPALKPFLEALAKAMLPILKALAPVLLSLARPLADLLVALTPIIQPLADIITQILKLVGPVIETAARALGWFIEHVIKPLVKALGWVVERIKDVIEWFQKLPRFTSTSMGRVSVDQRSALARDLGLSGHRALGGPVLAMRAYEVGERGPEVFVPPVNGTIVPIQKFSVPKDAGWDGGSAHPFTVVMEPGAVVINESNDPKKTLEAVRKGVQDAMARA